MVGCESPDVSEGVGERGLDEGVLGDNLVVAAVRDGQQVKLSKKKTWIGQWLFEYIFFSNYNGS